MGYGGAIQTLTTPAQNLDLSKISRVVLSSSGKLLAVPVNCDVELHDALSGERTHVVPGGMGEVAVALSPDDTLMAVANEDQSGIEIRELCRESEIDSTIDFTIDFTVPLYQPGGVMEFSPDGRLLVSTGYGKLCLWDTATGSNIHSLLDHFVAKVLFSPDSRWLVFAAGPASYKWDIHQGPGGIHPIPSHSVGSLHFSISPDSKVLAQEISAIGHVQLWSIETMESLHSFQVLHAVGDMAFSPDNKLFACGLLSGHIQRWDLDTGTPLQTLSGHTSPITNVAFSSDSKLLASASTDEKITIWDWVTGSALQTLSADTGVVAEISFCNEDTFLQTDAGVFIPVDDTSASASAAASPPPKAQPHFGLSPDGSWITRNGVNFLWLMDHRADTLKRYESRLALALKTGRVVFIGFRDLDSW
jgi:WD40 repeat protein